MMVGRLDAKMWTRYSRWVSHMHPTYTRDPRFLSLSSSSARMGVAGIHHFDHRSATHFRCSSFEWYSSHPMGSHSANDTMTATKRKTQKILYPGKQTIHAMRWSGLPGAERLVSQAGDEPVMLSPRFLKGSVTAHPCWYPVRHKKGSS